MSWWKRILSGDDAAPAPQRLDYLNEGLALERQGDLDGAITSYQLALRDRPQDVRILQYVAIAMSKCGRLEEAIRHYRRALELQPDLPGAHYGVAFLLLKRGDPERAADHLRAFLARPPRDTEMSRWVDHARTTLATLEDPALPDTP
ncbi:MAG TPA: tetratricopeptide repeat protein [Gemmatimonadales bacterium]|nr:tetratricopeptide repeat protein [Gemmatimonadales bacterium]